ncbi:hypothetical protein D3C78_1310640 [compost metagenome]
MHLGQHFRQLAVAGHAEQQTRDCGLRSDRHGHAPSQCRRDSGQGRQPTAGGDFGDFIERGVGGFETHAGRQIGGNPGLRNENHAHDHQGDQRGFADALARIAFDFFSECRDRIEAKERQHRNRHRLHQQGEVEGLRVIQRRQS